jgi:hypothetical protein
MRGIAIACRRVHNSASDVERYIGVAAICGTEQRGARLRASLSQSDAMKESAAAAGTPNEQSQAAAMIHAICDRINETESW